MPGRAAQESTLYEPHRIAILLALADAPGCALCFADLGRRLRYSEGNLIGHLRRLQSAGLVEARGNGGRGRASRTTYRLGGEGRAQLAAAGRDFGTVARAIELALAQREPGESFTDAPGATSPGVRGDPADEASRTVAAALDVVEERFSGPD